MLIEVVRAGSDRRTLYTLPQGTGVVIIYKLLRIYQSNIMIATLTVLYIEFSFCLTIYIHIYNIYMYIYILHYTYIFIYKIHVTLHVLQTHKEYIKNNTNSRNPLDLSDTMTITS